MSIVLFNHCKFIVILTQKSRRQPSFEDWRGCVKQHYFYEIKVDFGH